MMNFVLRVAVVLVLTSSLTYGQSVGDIRLVDGSNAQEGRVEVFLSGQWGTVCNLDWDDGDAQVACRQLGFSAFDSVVYPSSKFGNGSGPIHLAYVRCSGNELTLLQCGYSSPEVYSSHCDSYNIAGVGCTAPTGNSLRLADGQNPWEGRVEILTGGRWGTISSYSWDSQDADVVCRQLGYPDSGSFALVSDFFGSTSAPVVMNRVSCTGSESTLLQCGYYVGNYGSYGSAGVVCAPNGTADGDVRLINRRHLWEGTVQLFIAGEWGTVCDDGWDNYAANVVCGKLGYSSTDAVAVSGALFGEGLGPIQMDEVSCTGSETTLLQCIYTTSHDCTHGEDAGVRCIPSSGNIVRLSNLWEGRVEVFISGRWGTVCASGWDSADAKVVCRQLGYSTNGSSALTFDHELGSTLLDYGSCIGTESHLFQCVYSYPLSQCSSDAGVRCVPYSCENGEVRLAGGQIKNEGRVEMCLEGRWGTVSDHEWSTSDAEVVCKQLGYSTLGEMTTEFDDGTGPVFLDEVQCDGTESRLLDCTHTSPDNEYVTSHDEDIGIHCLQYSCQNGDIRLAGGQSENEGRVEVCLEGRWGTVSDDGWSTSDAEVACRQLGYSTQGVIVYLSAHFGEGTGPILMDAVGCRGSEYRLLDCPHDKVTAEDSHTEDAGVYCQPGPPDEVIMTQTPSPSPKPEDVSSTLQPSSQETTQLTFVYILFAVIALLLILILLAITGLLIKRTSGPNKVVFRSSSRPENQYLTTALDDTSTPKGTAASRQAKLSSDQLQDTLIVNAEGAGYEDMHVP